MALTLADRGKNCTLRPYFYVFVEHFLYTDLCNYKSSVHLQEDFPNISANTNSSVLIFYLEANSGESTVWKVRRQGL